MSQHNRTKKGQFSINCVRLSQYLHGKQNNNSSYLTFYAKLNSKWSTDQNAKAKTIKL